MNQQWICAAALALAVPAHAQTAAPYPVKPVRVIVPFAAGADTVARLLGAELTKAWGQQIVVENRAGAGGIIGAELVSRAPADGYTLMVIEIGGLTIRSSLYRNLPFDLLKDFAAVGVVAYGANVLVTHPSVPVRSVRDLIALARARPGQVNFAVPDVGSVAHLAAVELEQTAGVKFSYIPYKGGGPALLDLIGGQVDFSINGLLVTLPHVKSGRLRPLAVATKARHPALPEVPTLGETVPGHESGSRQSVLAPAGVPRDIVNRWNAEIARINATPAMQSRLAALGALPETVSPEEFQKFIAVEKARWARIIQKGQIKPD
jgi:tripartite-type tricarboxylate transporter receptor subunit TctC